MTSKVKVNCLPIRGKEMCYVSNYSFFLNDVHYSTNPMHVWSRPPEKKVNKVTLAPIIPFMHDTILQCLFIYNGSWTRLLKYRSQFYFCRVGSKVFRQSDPRGLLQTAETRRRIVVDRGQERRLQHQLERSHREFGSGKFHFYAIIFFSRKKLNCESESLESTL